MSEEYSVGYSEGYQAGWNAAIDATPPAPQRTWVGLTDGEVRQICGSVPSMKEVVREAEAKLKEKNFD